jgi:uncharacterized protein HemX
MNSLTMLLLALGGAGAALYFLKNRNPSAKEQQINNQLADLDSKVKQEEQKLQTLTKPEEKKMSPDEVSDYWKKELGDKK